MSNPAKPPRFPADASVVCNVFKYFHRQCGSFGKAMDLTASAAGVSKYRVHQCRKEKENYSLKLRQEAERIRKDIKEEKRKEEFMNCLKEQGRVLAEETVNRRLGLVLQPTTSENHQEQIVHVYHKDMVRNTC